MNALLGNLGDLGSHYAPYAWFFVVWSLPLVGVCAAGIATRRDVKDSIGNAASVMTEARASTWSTVLAVIGLALFATVYVFLVLYHQDLIGLDYAQLTARRFASVPIWPESGRFFPLGLQEYTFLGLLGTSAQLYHGFSIVELLVVLLCVFRILDGTPVWLRCGVMLFLMTLPAFVHSFFGLVYPERDLVVWLAIWLVCLQWFARTGSRSAFCGALIAAQFALYYKETAFVLVGGFVGARLLLAGWRDTDAVKQGQYARFAKDHSLEFAHLILCAVFVLVYVVVIARHVTTSYISANAKSATTAALSGYIHSDFVVDVLAMVLAWRLVSAAAGRRALDALWDPMAVGALAYALAYIKLGLVRDYYLAPTDVIAVLYVARAAFDGLRAQRPVAIAGVVLVVAWAFVQNVSNAAFEVLAREEFVDANVALGSFLAKHATTHGRSELSLFFPQTGGFQLMEFSAFLGHRGLRPEIGALDSASTPLFIVKSPHRFPGDRCHPSQELRCRYDSAPLPNDLVVFLPGRSVSATDLDSLRVARREVFHHRPEPTLVQRALRALAPADRLSARPPSESYVFAY